jgi:speckle-type POZ protein
MATSSQASSAAAGSVTTVVTETLAGTTRVLMTVDGYSKIMETLVDAGSGSIKSERFRAGGHSWYMKHHPEYDDEDDQEDEDDEGWVSVYLFLNHAGEDHDEVTARYELALLNRDGDIISSTQSFCTFSSERDCDYKCMAELNASPLLGDSFQVRCDLTIVEEVTAVATPELHRHLGGLLESQLGDVEIQVGSELFIAHKYILAARSTVRPSSSVRGRRRLSPMRASTTWSRRCSRRCCISSTPTLFLR